MRFGSTNHFARRRAGSCRWRSSLLPEPIVHGSAIRQIDAGRKSSGNGHPADGDGLRPARGNSRSAKFGPESTLDECPQGLSQFSRPLLGCDEQVIGEIDGGFHTGKHVPVFMARQLRLRRHRQTCLQAATLARRRRCSSRCPRIASIPARSERALKPVAASISGTPLPPELATDSRPLNSLNVSN